LATVTLLGACATASTRPTVPEKSFFEQQEERLTAEGASIVSDGCVLRDEVGTPDFIIKSASQTAGEAAAKSLADVLRSSGRSPVVEVTPFVCGGHFPGLALYVTTSGPSNPYNSETQQFAGTDAPSGGSVDRRPAWPVAQTAKDKPKPSNLPIALVQTVQDTPALADAYSAMLEKSENADIRFTSDGLTPDTHPLGLSDEQLSLLKSALKSANVWIVRGGGTEVSVGETIGVATLSAMATLGTVSVAPGSAGRIDVALVDLNHNLLLWTQHSVFRGDPGKAGLYTATQLAPLLAPFISNGDTKAAVAKVRQFTALQPHDAIALLGTRNPDELKRAAHALYDAPSLSHDDLDAVAKRISQSDGTEDPVTIDGIAWLCRVLGKSGDGRYKPLLFNVTQANANAKLRKYAKESASQLPDSTTEADSATTPHT